MGKVMTQAEKAAKEWLEKKGYEVRYNYNKDPDFELSDGKKIEVKRLFKNTLYFTKKQLSMPENVEILVMNEKLEPIAIIPLSEIKKNLRNRKIEWEGKKFYLTYQTNEISVIRIKCSRKIKRNFDIMLSEVESPEELLKILWIIYKTQPSVFNSARSMLIKEFYPFT